MAKPFIAARVPQKIEDKLNERIQETGLGKTEIIVKALAEYLGCSIDVPEETRAVDRLIAVEKELAELQKRVGVLEKPIEKAPDPKIPGQQVISFEPFRINNAVDNQIENAETTDEVIEEINDTDSDNSLLTNRQMTDLTGMKFESVRSRHKKSTSIEWQDKRYIPIKEGKYHKWQLVNS
jgi:hypothetical protein